MFGILELWKSAMKNSCQYWKEDLIGNKLPYMVIFPFFFKYLLIVHIFPFK